MTKGNDMTQDEKNARMEEWKRTEIVPIMQGLLASGHYTREGGVLVAGGGRNGTTPLAVNDAIVLSILLESEIEQRRNRSSGSNDAKP